MMPQYTELEHKYDAVLAKLQALQGMHGQYVALEAKFQELVSKVGAISAHIDEAACPFAVEGVALCLREAAENVKITRENLKQIQEKPHA